jgi:hypothetical protein
LLFFQDRELLKTLEKHDPETFSEFANMASYHNTALDALEEAYEHFKITCMECWEHPLRHEPDAPLSWRRCAEIGGLKNLVERLDDLTLRFAHWEVTYDAACDNMRSPLSKRDVSVSPKVHQRHWPEGSAYPQVDGTTHLRFVTNELGYSFNIGELLNMESEPHVSGGLSIQCSDAFDIVIRTDPFIPHTSALDPDTGVSCLPGTLTLPRDKCPYKVFLTHVIFRSSSGVVHEVDFSQIRVF